MLGRERLRLGAIALLMTLGLLGVLQYRWLREVADAQRSRMRSDAAARAAAIAQDFDREITRAFLMLPLDAATASSRDATGYAARYEEFRRASRFPGLVKDVYLLGAGEGGKRAVLRFSQTERRLVPAEWPRELERLRARLENEPGPGPSVLAEVPALLVPVPEPFAALAATPAQIRTLPPVALHQLVIRHAQARALGPCTVLLLDKGVLTTQLLPEIVAKRLSGDGGEEYEVGVMDSRGGAPIYGKLLAGEGDARADCFACGSRTWTRRSSSRSCPRPCART